MSVTHFVLCYLTLAVAVEQVKKTGVQREINVNAVNVRWLFSMNRDSSDRALVDIVVQVQSYYGYQLVTLRSPVQVLFSHISPYFE